MIIELLKSLNHFLVEIFSNSSKYPNCILLSGMVLGYKNDLDNNFKNTLKDLGLVHIVVVSGYNIGLLASFIHTLLGSLLSRLNRLIRFVIFEVLLLFYILLVGVEAPSLRAYVMWSLINFGKVYGRGVSVVYITILSAIGMLMFNFSWITDISFQLSFLATLGLVLYSEKIKSLILEAIRGLPHFLALKNNVFFDIFVSDLSSSVSATILVWPVISFHFGRVSIFSPIVNGLLLWPVPYATFLGLLGILIYLVFPILGLFVIYVASGFLSVFVFGINFLKPLGVGNLTFEVGWVGVSAYYSLLVLIQIYPKVRNMLLQKQKQGALRHHK